MNSYHYSLENVIVGTDQEIVTQLIASGVTARPIDLGELLFTLNMRGMLVKLAVPGEAGERWTGSIMNMIGAINAVGSEQQKIALSIWFSHITNPRNVRWDTTRQEHSAAFWALSQVFSDQPTMPTSADFSAVAALGGGWLFADLTVEQFAADKVAYELEQQSAEAELVAQEQSRLNHARKTQMYSALTEASRWVESQDRCPTESELLAHLTPNLPTEE
jgi:hypothetical protein